MSQSRQGSRHVNSSHNTMPKAYVSHFAVAGPPSISSGAILHMGVCMLG